MKIIKYGIVASIMLLSLTDPFSEAMAQNELVINQKSGLAKFYNLSSLSNLHFSNGNMIITQKSGASESIAIQNLQSMTFSQLYVSVPDTKANRISSASIYPNPASDQINIRFDAQESGTFEVSIFDLQGKLMKEEIVSNAKGENEISVDIKDLNTGLYFCRIQNGQEVEIIKIIKN